MRSAARLLIGALLLALLASCGGGDSPAVNSTWNLKAAYLSLSPNQNSTPLTYRFNLTGAVGSNQISGSGTLVLAPHISGTFENSAASQQTSSLEAVYTVVGVSQPVTVLASTITNWFSLNNGPFGETLQACSTGCSGGLVPVEYIVYGTSSSGINLPTAAASGASGTLYAGQRYSNSTKPAPSLGTVVATYSVTATSGGAAYFDVTITSKDASANANVVSTRKMRYLIDQNDLISLQALSLTDSSKDINFVVR
jgi:hypothetical protein